MPGGCPGTTRKAQELTGSRWRPDLCPRLLPACLTPCHVYPSPAQTSPPQEKRWRKLSLYFSRCASESFGHVSQKFLLRFWLTLLYIYIFKVINFKRNHNIESYHEHDVSIVFKLCFHVVAAYLLLNELRGLSLVCGSLAWLPPPFYFLISGTEERNEFANVCFVSIHSD